MKQINILISILFISFIIACKSNPQPSTNVSFEDFEEFYNKFYSDSIFQLSRIIFPLPGYNSDIESEIPDDFAESSGIKKKEEYFWEKEGWQFIKTIDNDTLIVKNFIKTDTIVIEDLIIPNSGFQIERKFKISDDKQWYLVYYLYQNL